MSSGAPNPTPKNKVYDRQLSWQVAQSIWSSFRYAIQGIRYAFTTQRNFRIHVLIGSIALGLGLSLNLEAVKMAVIALTIGVVLALELINTAIESVVDLTAQQTYHDLAKIAKDCAAGAVLVGALASLIVALSLLIPPLWTRLSSLLG
ncbi:diacylglycerol kinase family protein [Geitlerinema sp. P-1104]|uniref:diacylglycerol kinase family protein n=1 Tax=Geitlerinema sp. P-1104 TaxID=2546230 RepID=UPI001476BEEC|nr:diacylglycerol kinase family protein [Geitlerinema sp. P-1104]NMG59764.1 diacylglycerol kinase family protein [Geitlerinema sp. P-1104]